MGGKYKILFLAVLVVLITAASIHPLFAEANIPVPRDTQEVKRQKRILLGKDLDQIFFESSLSENELKDFYRQKLTRAGWIEEDLAEQLSEIPGVEDGAGQLAEGLKQNLSFNKDKEKIMVTFFPARFSSSKKTKYAVSHSEIPDLSVDESTDIVAAMPVMAHGPKKDVASVFPGAALIMLSEGDHFIRTGYFAKTDIQSAMDYYKTNMPSYGWILTKETQPENKGGDLLANTPTVAGSATKEQMKSMDVWLGDLGFTNNSGDTCMVIFSNVKTDIENAPKSLTTILVAYEEKN